MKKLTAIILVIGMTFIMTGCNKQIIDTTYKYTYGKIKRLFYRWFCLLVWVQIPS